MLVALITTPPNLPLVPGVACKLSGHRLGYGGGYYDAFLKQTSASKMAIGFEFQIVEKIPPRDEVKPKKKSIDFYAKNNYVPVHNNMYMSNLESRTQYD